MAINDAASAYAAQTGAADQAYKDAWANTPTGGAGQFGGSGPFAGASGGLSAVAMQNPASTVLQTKPLNVTGNDAIVGGAGLTTGSGVATHGSNLDALPTTPTASASTDPIKAAIETTSNFSRENPYVADVTDAGDVGRQAARPDRLLIDDTMSADEQYRRAWQNESNGFYGNTPDVTDKPATAAPEVAAPAAAEEDQYAVEFFTPGDGGDGQTILRDKKTGEVVHTFVGGDDGFLVGLESRNSDMNISAGKVREITGWERKPPAATAAPAQPANGAIPDNANSPNAADAARQVQNTGVNS